MDQQEAISKAKQYAQTAFAAASDEIARLGRDDLVKMRNQLAARGNILSGANIVETARILGEQIRAMSQAHLDSLLEGYELYGVTIDDRLAAEICDEVLSGVRVKIAGAKKQTFPGLPSTAVAVYPQRLEQSVGISPSSIRTQIDRRRLMAKKEESRTSINVYHVTGNNNRWVTNSQDSSVNVVTHSSDQIFAELRKQVQTSVPESDEKRELLGKIVAMEQSEKTPSFKQTYTEFIAAAANHMALIAPFIPALTEMLHRVL